MQASGAARRAPRVLRAAVLAGLCAAAGCSRDGLATSASVVDLSGTADLASPVVDLSQQPPDLAPFPWADPCGDATADPSCYAFLAGLPGSPFGLMSDPSPDPAERDVGVARDANGRLVLADGMQVGRYSLIIPGSTDSQGDAVNTEWYGLQWEADVPPGASLLVHAKSGAARERTDPSWAANPFTPEATVSPIDLTVELTPNITPNSSQLVEDSYLLVEVVFTASKSNRASPRLTSLAVGFKCACP